MTPAVTISRELAERLIAASKVCTGQDCPPFHHDLALAGDELRAALDAPASSGDDIRTAEATGPDDDKRMIFPLVCQECGALTNPAYRDVPNLECWACDAAIKQDKP